MPLVTRAGKGDILTHEELDGNFNHLDQTKAGLTSDNVLAGIQTFGKAVFQKSLDMAAGVIDVASGSHFSKVVTANVSLTLTNVPAAGTVASFILELTNGGAFTVTWWANIKWAGGTAPTLTAAGRDVVGFYTKDGGATWTGMLLAKDVK